MLTHCGFLFGAAVLFGLKPYTAFGAECFQPFIAPPAGWANFINFPHLISALKKHRTMCTMLTIDSVSKLHHHSEPAH